MPDTPATPDAETSPSEADELAKGVVGVPIRCWRCVVDDDGIHARRGLLHGPMDVPWRDVAAINTAGMSLTVEVKRGDAGPRPLFDIDGSSNSQAAVLSAWEEYSGRRMERDGNLAGAWSRPLRRWTLITAIPGAILVCYAVFLAFEVIDMTADPTAIRSFPVGLGGYIFKSTSASDITLSWLLTVTLFVGGCGLLVQSFLRSRLIRLRGEDWTRWEVTREGVAYWNRGKRMVLAPGPGDRITPKEAVINGERVPLRQMAYPLASRLVMAMGERSGARLARSRSYWLVPALIVGLTVGIGLFYATMGRKPTMIVVFVLLALILPVVEMIIAARHWPKELFHGRAMLERLGW